MHYLEDILTHAGVEEQGMTQTQVAPVDESQIVAPPIQVGENGLPLFQERMLKTIEEVDQYTWQRGELGGLDWGFEAFNKAFEGLNTGVHLIAGQSNVGKSGLCMQLALQIALHNREVNEKKKKKAFVLYFSLDDNLNELLPRFVAIDQKIPINSVRFPRKYQENKEFMRRREIGFQRMRELVTNFAMLDSNSGDSIEFIESTTEQYVKDLQAISPDYQIVLIIDNFHDISVEKYSHLSENEKYNYISDQLTLLATKFDCPIICTAELRKINGNRRPRPDDVRETVKIQYRAKAILLCYNEVSLRGQQASIYWRKENNPDKQPVFEVHVGKNKFSSFKGQIFFEFVPEMSFFREVPQAKAQQYIQMISA